VSGNSTLLFILSGIDLYFLENNRSKCPRKDEDGDRKRGNAPLFPSTKRYSKELGGRGCEV